MTTLMRVNEEFIECGFVEAKINLHPDQQLQIWHNLMARRKQYGFRHCVTGTIHSAMGDTYDVCQQQYQLMNHHFYCGTKGN